MRGHDLRKDSIIRLFFVYLVPAVTGFLIMTIHVLLDGVFVGRGVGTNGLAAVNIVLPVFILFNAISTLIGVGGGATISIKFGEREEAKASNIFSQIFFINILISLLFSVLGLVFLDDLIYLLGANKEIFQLVRDYLKVLITFSFFIISANIFNIIIRNDGGPRYSMIQMIMGAVINCLLNYLFIFVLNWGLYGAALATAIAHVVSTLFALLYFILKKGQIRFVKPELCKGDINRVIKNGIPSFINEICAAVITFLLNITLMKFYGSLGVSAYSVLNYIYFIGIMFFIGISMAIQPILSFNFGANEKERVKKTFKLGILSALSSGILLYILFNIFDRLLIKIFTIDKELISLSLSVMNIFFMSYFFMGVNIVTIIYYQSIEKTKISSFYSLLRGIIFVTLGIISYPYLFGKEAIWTILPSAELFTLITIILLYRKIGNNYK
jgi:putative MATE family efflux protein